MCVRDRALSAWSSFLRLTFPGSLSLSGRSFESDLRSLPVGNVGLPRPGGRCSGGDLNCGQLNGCGTIFRRPITATKLQKESLILTSRRHYGKAYDELG